MTPDEVSCALRVGREKGQFDTLGESGIVGGGRVEALYFILTFAMCCVVPFTVSKSKSSHENAGQDRGKFDSGSRRGGDPCSFSHRLRAERVEPFAGGLALGVELDGRRPRRTRARAGLRRLHGIHLRRLRGFRLRRPHIGSVCGDRMGHFCGDRMGRFCGNRMGSISGDRVGRLICFTETKSTR